MFPMIPFWRAVLLVVMGFAAGLWFSPGHRALANWIEFLTMPTFLIGIVIEKGIWRWR